ncbi:MAG: tetratricopeptide repeat protein [Chlorobiaceae bacterium]|nr:tetratricopeptide repeat protein [Chlorobiaceae bacterium]NTW09937.1 tetratricopeptide repeat protein [Chlorobiaceae bacterium]
MKKYLRRIAATALMVLFSGSFAIAGPADDYFSEGLQKHQQRNLTEAVRLYSKAIDINPSFTMAYQMRGVAEQQLKQYPQAINDFTMVIASADPLFKVVGYYNRGVLKNMTGDYAGAIPDFTQAIEIDRRMAAAYFHRGIAKSKTGDLAGKLLDFREAAKMGDTTAEKWLDTYYPGWRELQIPVPGPS